MRPPILVLLVRLVFVASLALAGCQRQESPAPTPPPAVEAAAPTQIDPVAQPFRVVGVTLGNAIGPDKRVTAPSTLLAPSDTIYASVASSGSAEAVNLSVRWYFEDGQLVNEESLQIAPAGPAVTEFHIAKPDGWPTGRYKVEILADGTSVNEREFEVR